MTYIETYGKKIVALCVPFITWALNRFLKGKARLEIWQWHAFNFRVIQQDDADGNAVPPLAVHTRSLVVSNTGREVCKNIELVFNFKPPCLNIWPPRSFVEKSGHDDRYIIIFDSLSPDEAFDCEVLAVNADLPDLVTIRSDQCMARFVDMLPQPVCSRGFQVAGKFLVALGMATAVYGVIVLIQFLVLNTPFKS